MKESKQKIGIIGLGFLGGSLAKSLSELDSVDKIIATDVNTKSLEMAYEEGVITDYAFEVNEKFSDCDIVFICTPVSYIVDYAKKLKKYIKPNCIVTDIGSTKKSILEGVKDLKIEFIGGHPMIGSEKSGYLVSRELLFEHSYYILTVTENNNLEAVEKLKELISKIGALPIIVDGNKHDYITAVISQVPQVIASSLVKLVKDLDDDNETMKTLAAGGFKDTTRIASSDPTMWEDICTENKDEILKVLNYLENIVNDFKSDINDRKKLHHFFENSKKYRDSFINRKINGNTMPELNIVIKDENGSLAKIVNVLSEIEVGINNIEIINNRENNYGSLKIVLKNYEERDKAYDAIKKLNYDIVKIN